MKLLGSRLLLLAAFFTFSSAYFTSPSDNFLSEIPVFFNLLNQNTSFSFNATFADKAVRISWKIEKPLEGSFYMIQRSDNGTDWYTIGGIAIREKADMKESYEMFDANLEAKTYHYKLKELKPDGSIVFSSSVSVFAGYVKPISFYPNPAKRILNFDVPLGGKQGGSVEIFDQNGRLVLKEILKETFNGQSRQVNVENLVAGVYVVNVRIGAERYAGRFVRK